MAEEPRSNGKPRRKLITRIEARRLLGEMPERTFCRLEAEGILAAEIRGRGRKPSKYDPAKVVADYIAHVRSATVGSDREARAARDRSQAALNELRLKQQQRELLPREEVIRTGRAYIVAARAKLLALPRRMTQAGIVPPDRQGAVVDMIREALEEMARWRTQLDLLKAGRART
jgi:hypothetical protein